MYIPLLLRSFTTRNSLSTLCLFRHLGLPLRYLRLPLHCGLPGLFSLRALDTLSTCGFTCLNVTSRRRCRVTAFSTPPALDTRGLTGGFDVLQRIVARTLLQPLLNVTCRRLGLCQFVLELVLGSGLLCEPFANVGAGWPALGGQSSGGRPLSGFGETPLRSRKRLGSAEPLSGQSGLLALPEPFLHRFRIGLSTPVALIGLPAGGPLCRFETVLAEVAATVDIDFIAGDICVP